MIHEMGDVLAFGLVDDHLADDIFLGMDRAADVIDLIDALDRTPHVVRIQHVADDRLRGSQGETVLGLTLSVHHGTNLHILVFQTLDERLAGDAGRSSNQYLHCQSFISSHRATPPLVADSGLWLPLSCEGSMVLRDMRFPRLKVSTAELLRHRQNEKP